jgi:predicted glycogen debranching enzyme
MIESDLIRRLPWPDPKHDKAAGVAGDLSRFEPLLTREWLVTNGLGGYAAGTISGVLTRRFHGLLIPALPGPHGRTMMLNHLAERICLPDNTTADLCAEQLADGSLRMGAADYLREFRLEAGLPVWTYAVGDMLIEKRVLLPHHQNTVHVNYRLVSPNASVRLELRPSVHFRPHEGRVDASIKEPYALTIVGNRYKLSGGDHLPPLRMMVEAEEAQFTVSEKQTEEFLYRVEKRRGYDHTGRLWSPGYFHLTLSSERDATLVASTEPWESMRALSPADAALAEGVRRRQLIAAAHVKARAGVAAEMVLAADQFIITPAGRAENAIRSRAFGDDVRTVIAGYHWFTDWGRDTMISLEGLTLATGRHFASGCILRTFTHYIRDGLIPNMFPEGESEGLYHTADATLWFFHAIDRYVEVTGDRTTLRYLIPKLLSIIEHHINGTRFGIAVDPSDGLLRQGAEGYQLTWMDAKVDGWVVTPRRGKPVEINALWYNALKLLEGWLDQERGGEGARVISEHAARARRSFNERFWYEEGGYLYDLVDGEEGDDAACRPNQLLAISLAHPVLDRSKWEPVLNVARERLLTPAGLRSLAPGHRDYKPRYDGDLRSRDAAYHQGTVWGWLIGPFIDAWLKLHPSDLAGARGFLEGLTAHMGEACIGSISEIFDAEPPYTPRGCVAQAWSVAEALRCWVKTAE